MLVLAAAFICAQQGRSIEDQLSSLEKGVIGHAQRLSWGELSKARSGPSDDPLYVKVQLVGGNTSAKISVYGFQSATKAANTLKSLRTQSDPRKLRTQIEEPTLTDTGLSMDVLDFSDKRISNMKTYATTGGKMRISGRSGNFVIWITTDSLVPALGKMRTDEQAYDDIVGLGKFLAQELKK